MPDVDHEWQGVDVVQTSDSVETNVKAIEHFFVTMGVEGLRYGSISRLYDSGYTEVEEILFADKQDLVNVLGRNGIKNIRVFKTCLRIRVNYLPLWRRPVCLKA